MSHEERRWLLEEPTQSRISPKKLEYTKMIGNSVLTVSGTRQDVESVFADVQSIFEEFLPDLPLR